MLKLLAKRGKSTKGFTLIELIVVIAIIAILALLLVPRFAGFTDDARVSNDRNACRTIERAFMTLLANDTIRKPATDSTITITGATGAFGTPTVDIPYISAAAGPYGDATGAELQIEVESLTGTLKTQSSSHTRFTVTLKSTGEVTCEVS